MSMQENPQAVSNNTSNAPLAITLTPAALAHVRKMLEKEGQAIGLRIAVKRSGCSGLKYDMSVAQERRSEDLCFAQEDGLLVLIEPKDFPFLSGLTIDLVKQGFSSRLAFINPKRQGTCGCGESFSA